MTATRLLRNKWVLILGVLAVVGMVAGQSLADPPHHGDYYGRPSWGSWGGHGHHWTPSFGHYRHFGGYNTYGGGYYSPPVVVRPHVLPYYGGGYGSYGCSSGFGVTIIIR